MRIDVTDQLPALNEHLTALRERLNGDLTPLMQSIGSLLEGSTRQRFADKQPPDGDPWADLMPSTKAQKHGGGGILVEYGDLMRSGTYHASSASVAVGTPESYGKYHQTGTRHMVARPWLGLSTSDKTAINELLDKFMMGAVNG